MGMLRQEFKALTPEQLKKLIKANLDFLKDVAPFPETQKIINAFGKSIGNEGNVNNLRAGLVEVMKIVTYWDTHQAANTNLFNPVEKDIVNKKLLEAEKITVQPTQTYTKG